MKKQFILLCAMLSVGIIFPISTYAASQNIPYTVVQGDTLSKIARNYHTTVQALVDANHLANDKLQIGQLLQVPIASPKSDVSSLRENTVNVNKASATMPSSNPAGTKPASFAPLTQEQPAQPEASNAASQALVNVPILNVRSLPSTESEIVGKLSYGTLVDVVEPGSDWTKIRYNNQEAYIATAYIRYPVLQADRKNANLSSLAAIVQPLLKTPYVFGGMTPEGFDCSGFTLYVYQQLGITLPRTSEEQFTVGQEVPFDQLQPGDLLFYDALKKGKISHVAMYMGDGMIVHANGTEVRYEKVENMNKLYPYYGAKRIIQTEKEG